MRNNRSKRSKFLKDIFKILLLFIFFLLFQIATYKNSDSFSKNKDVLEEGDLNKVRYS